jgi:hypothetical protein
VDQWKPSCDFFRLKTCYRAIVNLSLFFSFFDKPLWTNSTSAVANTYTQALLLSLRYKQVHDKPWNLTMMLLFFLYNSRRHALVLLKNWWRQQICDSFNLFQVLVHPFTFYICLTISVSAHGQTLPQERTARCCINCACVEIESHVFSETTWKWLFFSFNLLFCIWNWFGNFMHVLV